MAFRNYILCFALVASTIAGPINVQDGDLKCAKTCEASLSDSGKFQYTPGNTYTYVYEGTTETRLQGASEQTSTLKIDATADIEVISKCEFALKLNGVKLTENGQISSSSDEFKQKLEAKPLRFAFQDGVIENICSTEGEDERVLNIKRGVLSTFQNSMKELAKEGLFTETDVSGTCPTTYTSVPSTFGGTYTITKTKDILACTERTGNISALHSERYNVPSKMQNAPLLKTTHKCEQTISKHQIYETQCTEVLVFRPFSKDGSGAVTTAKQNLKFSSKKSSVSVSESPVNTRSSLLFHHMYDESIDVNAKSDVIALLQEICSEVSDDIKKDSPKLFGALISKMKRLDTDKMVQVYNAVNGGRICSSQRGKQFFYDAVPMVGTEASLALTMKLITDKTVQGVEADAWLTQLAFIPRPSYEMLAAIMPLLNDDAIRTKALLGVSAMVHKICENNANCQRNTHVADFISILNSNIGSTCAATTKEQRDLIMLTLKAFGNAGDAVTSSSVIGRCVTNTDLDIELRVIALQAYRRMPCSIAREDAMRIYQNFDNDAELRIHAFLAIMTCPTNVLPKVRMVLSGEPVNQVGSFVWTYLENLKETSSPLRQELSSILEDAKLRQDFNLDARKFSRNLEKSFFSDYLNAGAQIESNLIWSQRSYIPRSAMLNVTVDMFGNSINLVEFGGRVQGLERIVEKFFGPNGYFSQKETKELMDNKRQTANYISSFDNVFKTPSDKITTSMYVKMFGNELQYSELDSSEWSDIEGFNIVDFLIKVAEPKKIDLTKNVQFLDSTLIIPTCVGLPMNLTVNGTASVSVDIDGNVDLRNIAASPRSFDINGHLKPSATVMISGMMGVDAIVTKASMKMVSSMHSSTQLDGTVSLKDGQVFSVNLNTPKDKMEIFHVETEFFMNGKEMTMPEPAKVYKKCTPAGVTKVIGMEMCVDITLPTFHQTGLPLPPFTGPMNAQIFIEKKDTHKGYAFTAKYETTKEQISGSTYEKKVVHMSIDTPGSQIDRKLLIEGVYDPAKMMASAQLMSPWKKLEWTTSFKNTVEMKQALSSFKVDGTQTYSVDAHLSVDEKTVKTVWTPSLTITTPGKPDMTVTGTIESGTGKTVASVDLAIKNFSKKPITLTSSLSKIAGGQSYDFVFDLKSDLLTSAITSSVAVASKSYNGKADVSYQIQGRPIHRFNLAGKFIDESIGDLMKYSANAGFIPTEYPDYQFNIDGELQLTAKHMDTSLNVQFSKEKFSISHKTTKQGTWDNLDLETSSTFKYPSKSIDMSTELKHKHNVNEIKSSASVSYSGQTVQATVDLSKAITDKYTGVASLSYPGRELSIDTSVEKMMDEHKVSAEAKWGTDANSKVSLTSTYKAGDMHQVTSDIKIPGHPLNIVVSLRPDPVNFMGKTTVMYNSNTYSLETEHKLEATRFTTKGSWTSPQRAMSYNVDMSNANGQMKATSDFSWATDKKVSMSAEYNNRDTSSMYSRDSKVSITTPFGTQSYTTEMEFKPSDMFMKMSNELVMDGERSTLSGRYSMGSGELSLVTPLIKHEAIKFVTLKFSHDEKSLTSSVSWNPSQQISANAKWSESMYSADFVTPFKVGKLGASLEHTDTTSAAIKAYWNDLKGSLSVERTEMKEAKFTLTYPENTVTGVISQNGDMDRFTSEAELNINSDKYWSKLVFSGKGPYSLEIDFNSPLAIKKISTNLYLEGTPMDFNTRATLIWDNNRIRSSLKFSGKEGEFSVNTPWRKVNGEYTITGQKESFTGSALFKWADDKQIDGSVTFDMTSDIKMSFQMKSPLYEAMSGSFEHSGPMTNFNNKASLTWAPTKTITVTSEFNMDRATAKAGIVGVPTEIFQKGDISFVMTQTSAKTDVTSSLTWNDNQSIVAKGSLTQSNGYALSASLKGSMFETVSMDITHTRSDTTFVHDITVQWASTQKITSSIDITMGSELEAKINVNTPWKQISYTASRRGDVSSELVVSSSFSWETGKEITSHMEFSHLSDMKLTWSVNTPWEMVKALGFTLNHRGTTLKSFSNQMEVKYNELTANLATTWDMSNGASLTVLSTNPWKNFNSKLVYTGVPMDFTSSVELTMDGKTYSSNAAFAYSDAIVMTFDINTVVYKPVSLALKLSMEKISATLKWGESKTISGLATLTLKKETNAFDALINFNTPFEGYKSGEATINHTGGLKSFREVATVSFSEYNGRFEAGFSSTGAIRGDMTLTSSWYNAKGSFHHSGELANFENNAEFTYGVGKTVSASSKWNMQNGIDSEMKFSSPFKTFDAKYNHKMSLSGEVTSQAEFNMDQEQIFSSDLLFRNVPANIKFEYTFISKVKSFSTKYTHTGTLTSRCNANAEFTWDTTNKMVAEWSVSMINGFETSVDIKTPWRNFAGAVTHTGTTMESFENTLSLTYDQGKTIKIESTFKMTPEFVIESKFTSPFKNANILYRHSGDLKSLTCHLEGAYETVPLTADLKWDTLSGYEASLDVKSPWKNFKTSFETNTDLNNLSSQAMYECESVKLDSSLTFSISAGYKGTFVVNTPWRKISANFDHSGELKNFSTEAEFSWETGKSISVEATHNGVTGSAKIASPWKVLSSSYRMNGPMENFDSSVEFSWEADKKVVMDVRADTRTGMDTMWKLAIPSRTMCFELKYDADYNMNTEISWETGKSVTAEITNRITGQSMETNVKVNTPWRNFVGFHNREGIWTKFDTTTHFSWETGKEVRMITSFDKDGLDGSVSINTPWRDVSLTVKQSGDMTNFDGEYDLSWETGKKISTVLHFNRANGWENRVAVTTPWRTLTTNSKFTGELAAFTSSFDLSWEAGKEIKMTTTFDMAAMDGSTTINTPWRDLSLTVKQSGDLTKFNGEYEFSWETSKKMTGTLSFNRENGWESSAEIETPWRTFTTNSKFTGELTNWSSSFDLSWETGKMVSTSTTFKMDPLAYKMRLSDSMKITWEPSKTIEMTTSFDNYNDVTGSMSLKSPFYSDMSLSVKHTQTSGEMTLVAPMTEDLSLTYSYTDRYNFNSKVIYGTMEYTSEAVTTWNNGLQTTMKVTCPETSTTLEIDHQGDLATFTNKIEGVWNGQTVKLTTNADVPKMTFSQTLETPMTGYETLSWSGSTTMTDTSIATKYMMAKNTDKFEVDFNGNVEWKVKSIFTYSLKVNTPFTGYEENKLSEVIEISQRRISYKSTHYIGSMANAKSVEFYAMKMGSTTKDSLDTYIKVTLDGELSEVSFNYMLEGGELTSQFKSDIKAYPEFNREVKLTVEHSRTEAGMNQKGTVDITTPTITQKIMWNAGSNSYMCETGFSLVHNGEEFAHYTHKTTWSTGYQKLDHSIIFKSAKSEMFADCQFELNYDLTKPTKTFGLTLFNNPSKPFDFKSEVVLGDSMSMMVELTTPFEQCKIMKSTITVNKGQQPWSVSMESKLNDQTITASGRMSYEEPAIFNINMSFKSQIPMFESLSLTLTNSKLQDQWKPHMVLQYAADKTIEMSGIFSWTNQYKASMDVNTPFDSLKSMVADFTVDGEFPSKMTSSFEFKTSQMSKKLSSSMTYDMEAKSFSLAIQSPFESVKAFEFSGSSTPRLSVMMKLNGESLFSLSGSSHMDSWTKHSMDVTITYPFLNRYTRIQIDNDLTKTEAMKSYIDLMYSQDKELSFKFDFKSGTTNTFSLSLETPFEKLEKTTYVATYSGNSQTWSESTRTESYYGTITSSTSFSMVNGITYHQTITGEMKNGIDNFNLQKDLVFTGSSNKFDIQASISGSFVPELKIETAWQYSPVEATLKANFNQHSIEYTHKGVWTDFTCTWKVASPLLKHITYEESEKLQGTWTFKKADGYTFSTNISSPKHGFKLNWHLSSLAGNFSYEITDGEKTNKLASSFKRSASPFRYESSLNFECHNGHKFVSSIVLTENSIDFPMINYDDKEIFTIRANVPLNADEEYKPTIVVVVGEKTYEFDGLYKNVGEGLIRDFKLHMNGPRGVTTPLKLEFEFRTQSNQLVPGDMKFFFSFNPDQPDEFKLLDLTGSWGNDHATFIFREPHPMKYQMDFSVSTTGQTATFEANWDTTATDKNAKLEIVNKFSSSSRKMVSDIDINVIYTGISRGLTSEMEWTADSFKHLFTLDYNGKSIGYDFKCDPASGASLELISQWRSVKVTWNQLTVSNGNELQLGFYWDSQKDTSKRFYGTSRLVKTGTNTYKWTTTVSHPALIKTITVTDTIAYDTTQHFFDFKKVVSYSTDSSKDIAFDINLQKDLNWGISLKQDFNKINIRVGTEFTSTSSITSFKYMASNGQMKNFAFITRYNPSTMTASVELQSPMKTVKFTSLSTKSTVTLSVTVDGKTYSTDFTLRPEEYYMLIKFTGVQGNMKFVAQKLVGGYEMQLTKTEGSKTTVEGLAAISMNESRVVNGKLHWNPTLVSEIKSQIAAIRSSLKETVKTMSTAASTEATNKMNRMQLGSDFEQIVPHSKREYGLIKDDFNTAKLMVQQGYESNIFFLKSIDKVTSSFFSNMAVLITDVCAKLDGFYTTVIQPGVSLLSQKTQQVMLDLSTEFGKMKEQMLEYNTMISTELMKYTQTMREDLAEFNAWLQTYIDIVAEFMAEHPVVQTLKSYHVAIMSSFNSAADLVYGKVNGVVNPQIFRNIVFAVHNFITNVISETWIAKYVDVSVITGIVDTMMYKTHYYFTYYDIIGNMKFVMSHARNVAAEYLDEYLTHYVDDTLDNFKWVTYDLAAGQIEVEFVIPSSLDKFDMVQISRTVMSAVHSFLTHFYDYHFNFADMIYMYIPSTYKHILPPFDVQGIIAGQHIRTFDRRHYEFSSGKCSYLLARDFHDGNFTIFVNYNGEEQSLTVHSNGKVVDIQQDNTVKMDNAKTELPVQFFNTSITRMGPKIILENSLGVKVICDNMNGLCSVEMSGHYFAKTGGLFGTYNYEPLDDFTTSSNKNTTDVLNFANSWTSRCTGTNTAKTFTHVEGSKEYKACAALFKDNNSLLSSCFEVVKPEPAFNKCIHDMSKDVTLTAVNGPCKASMFYQAECKFAGVMLQVPTQCVACDVNGVTIHQGETSKISQPVMNTDVVIVVEEKMCNYDIDVKLPQLAKLIESSLSRRSISNIRFGLVGFGGQGVHSPSHVHTMNSKMFATRSDLSLGTSALKFSAAGNNTDVYDAIDFAAQYPFRAGASKMIVVVPCSDCQNSRHSHQAIAERLYANDIKLHVLNDFSYEMTVAGKNPSTNYLFGIDNYAVYSLRDIRATRGNTRLYPLVTKPVDACSSLALQTNGLVFDVNMMKQMRASTIKSFQTVFANVMANNVSPRSCTSCTCEYNALFMTSRSVCNSC